MHPAEFAVADVPGACRWHLSGGIAYRHSDNNAWCRTPHAVLCPRRIITTQLTPHLEEARRQLAARTRALIDTGSVHPASAPASPPKPTAGSRSSAPPSA
nr:DUF6083 domain-containing protein [Streptomyces sp. 135]